MSERAGLQGLRACGLLGCGVGWDAVWAGMRCGLGCGVGWDAVWAGMRAFTLTALDTTE